MCCFSCCFFFFYSLLNGNYIIRASKKKKKKRKNLNNNVQPSKLYSRVFKEKNCVVCVCAKWKLSAVSQSKRGSLKKHTYNNYEESDSLSFQQFTCDFICAHRVTNKQPAKRKWNKQSQDAFFFFPKLKKHDCIYSMPIFALILQKKSQICNKWYSERLSTDDTFRGCPFRKYSRSCINFDWPLISLLFGAMERYAFMVAMQSATHFLCTTTCGIHHRSIHGAFFSLYHNWAFKGGRGDNSY